MEPSVKCSSTNLFAPVLTDTLATHSTIVRRLFFLPQSSLASLHPVDPMLNAQSTDMRMKFVSVCLASLETPLTADLSASSTLNVAQTRSVTSRSVLTHASQLVVSMLSAGPGITRQCALVPLAMKEIHLPNVVLLRLHHLVQLKLIPATQVLVE